MKVGDKIKLSTNATEVVRIIPCVYSKKELGRKSRADGKAFELKVRKNLESKGWIVDRWSNNVEFAKRIGTETNMKDADDYPAMKMMSGRLIPAKHQFNPFTKAMTTGHGFPDFICYMYEGSTGGYDSPHDKILHPRVLGDYKTQGLTNLKANYILIGIECKMTGKLDKIEKEKCDWLLKNNIFSKIFIASKKGKEIVMEDVKE